MSSPDLDTVLDWVAGVWPVDGPHDEARLATAGAALGELVRYLAHATRGPLPAPQVYALLGALGQTARSHEQVCRQLVDRMTELAADPTLRVDEPAGARPSGRTLAMSRAFAARAELWGASDLSAALAAALSGAQQHISPLYHDQAAGGAR